MKVLSQSQLVAISGGGSRKRSFYGFIPSAGTVKNIIKVMIFAPVLGYYSTHHDFFKGKIEGQKEDQPEKRISNAKLAGIVIGSMLGAGAITVVNELINDAVDDLYEYFDIIPENN
jgi:hypothetical protein